MKDRTEERAACIGFDALRIMLGMRPQNASVTEVIAEITKASEKLLKRRARRVLGDGEGR